MPSFFFNNLKKISQEYYANSKYLEKVKLSNEADQRKQEFNTYCDAAILLLDAEIYQNARLSRKANVKLVDLKQILVDLKNNSMPDSLLRPHKKIDNYFGMTDNAMRSMSTSASPISYEISKIFAGASLACMSVMLVYGITLPVLTSAIAFGLCCQFFYFISDSVGNARSLEEPLIQIGTILADLTLQHLKQKEMPTHNIPERDPLPSVVIEKNQNCCESSIHPFKPAAIVNSSNNSIFSRPPIDIIEKKNDSTPQVIVESPHKHFSSQPKAFIEPNRTTTNNSRICAESQKEEEKDFLNRCSP